MQGFKAGPTPTTNSRYNEVGAGLLPDARHPAARRPRVHAQPTRSGAPKVAIVNEAFAKKFNLGRDAVGKRMATGRRHGKLDIEIVGLVQNAKYSEVKDEIPPLFFMPVPPGRAARLDQLLRADVAANRQRSLASIRKAVARLDPNLPVENLKTMPQQVRENVFLDRIISMLSAAFAVLATLLAAVGLYGVLAYTVAQRTREIGLRMALGAAPGRVRGMVLRQVGLMTLIGGSDRPRRGARASDGSPSRCSSAEGPRSGRARRLRPSCSRSSRSRPGSSRRTARRRSIRCGRSDTNRDLSVLRS